jgi:hypothetical protein
MADNTHLLNKFRQVVREEIAAVEKRLNGRIDATEESLVGAIIEQGKLILDAVEVNAHEQNKTAGRVDRIEKHLNLPPVK